MKKKFTLAISNLAWSPQEDTDALTYVANSGISSLEISPFRTTADLTVISPAFAKTYARQISLYKLQIIALQALLFRFPNLLIFQDKENREQTFAHLCHVIEFAHAVGAKSLIFGSPKNKIRGKMKYAEAFAIAVDFFGRIAAVAAKNSVTFCIEPTPSVYGTDFLRDTKESIALISAVDNEALKLNVDLGALQLNKEDLQEILPNNLPHVGYIHISEPYLKPIHRDYAFHEGAAQIILTSGYSGTVSIEMLPQPLQDIKKTLSFVTAVYI